MALINIGTGPNTGDGESLRSAFNKINIALNNDAAYNTTITNALATKASITGLASGSVPVTESGVVSTANVTIGKVSRTQGAKNSDLVSVKDFGAVGNGINDDTAAIIAALNYAMNASYNRWSTAVGDRAYFVSKGPGLFFPAGNYIWNGPGFDLAGLSTILRLYGESNLSTRITIASGQYFIDSTVNPTGMEIQNLHFQGGAGGIVFRNSAVNATRTSFVRDCIFSRQTVIGFGHLSQDWPGLEISKCVFDCSDTAIGLLLSGLTADGSVHDCTFNAFKYGLKLAPVVLAGTDKGPATPLRVWGNQFFRLDTSGVPRYDVWIVPNIDTNVNAGRGIHFFGNKFGAENLAAGDARVLVAAAGSGTDGITQVHNVTAGTADRHHLQGLMFRDNNVDNATPGSAAIPFIYSYVARLFYCSIDDLIEDGQVSSYITYDSNLSPDDFQFHSTTNQLSLARAMNASSVAFPSPVNRPGTWIINDPHAWTVHGNIPLNGPASSTGDYANLLTTRTASFTTSSSSISAIANSLGDSTDACEVTCSGTLGRIFANLVFASASDGRQAWLEGELQAGSSTSLTYVLVQITDNAGNILVQRSYPLYSFPNPFRIPFIVSKTDRTSLTVRFVETGYSAGVREKFKVGLVRCYQSRSPITHGRLYTGYSQTTVGSAGGATALPATPSGYTTVSINGTEYVMPFYAKS